MCSGDGNRESQVNMADSPLQIEQPLEASTLLRLNRPAGRNALDGTLLRALAEAVDDLSCSPQARAGVRAGAVFSSGGDIDGVFPARTRRRPLSAPAIMNGRQKVV